MVKLNRFTTLPVLLDLLLRKKLTLLDPKMWDDRNDSEVILEYKKRKGIKSLLVICFSYGDETVHHWKSYSNGSGGCVIEFDAAKLIALLNKIPKIKHKKVEYKKLSEVEDKEALFNLDDLPFIKRWPYRCEEEYRVIFETNDEQSLYEIDIPLDIIRRITISQHMPESIYSTLRVLLKEIDGNSSRINRSTLYENKRWMKSFKQDKYT